MIGGKHMKKVKSIYIIIGLIIVIMLLTTACRRNNKDTLSETPQTPVEINDGQSDDSNDNDEAINNIEVGEVNKLKLSNLDNKEMALLQSKGKPVVLSFWVSWSDHSIKQLETLENVYPLLEGDVIFIAVNATSFETKNEQDLIGYTRAKDLSLKSY